VDRNIFSKTRLSKRSLDEAPRRRLSETSTQRLGWKKDSPMSPGQQLILNIDIEKNKRTLLMLISKVSPDCFPH
jgi:hypothetical protein